MDLHVASMSVLPAWRLPPFIFVRLWHLMPTEFKVIISVPHRRPWFWWLMLWESMSWWGKMISSRFAPANWKWSLYICLPHLLLASRLSFYLSLSLFLVKCKSAYFIWCDFFRLHFCEAGWSEESSLKRGISYYSRAVVYAKLSLKEFLIDFSHCQNKI